MERIRLVQCATDSVVVYLGIEKTPESTEDFEATSVLVEQGGRNRIVSTLLGGVRLPRWTFKKERVLSGPFFFPPPHVARTRRSGRRIDPRRGCAARR